MLVKHYRENIEDAEVRTGWPAARVCVRSAVASEPSLLPEQSFTMEDMVPPEPQPGLLRCIEGALLLPGAPLATGLARTLLLGAEWLAELLAASSAKAEEEPSVEAAPECDTPFDPMLPPVAVVGPRGETIEADYVLVTVPLPILKVEAALAHPPSLRSCRMLSLGWGHFI